MDATAWDLAKGFLKFFRRQPLLQLAITASLWAPLAIALRLIGSAFGFEKTVDVAVAPWAFQVAAAGLAYLGASTFVTLSNKVKAVGRRKALALNRAELKRKRQEKRDAQFEQIRTAVDAIGEEERKILRIFVDTKMTSVPARLLKQVNAIHNLEGIGWVWTSDAVISNRSVYLRDFIYEFLLEHPALVGSEIKPTLVHTKLATAVRAYERNR